MKKSINKFWLGFVAVMALAMIMLGFNFIAPQNKNAVYAGAGGGELSLTAVDGSVSITFKCDPFESESVSYKKSTDADWTTVDDIYMTMAYGVGIQVSLTEGQYVMFKGTNVKTGDEYHFSMSATSEGATVEASGDVTSLTTETDGDVELTEYCYCSMFADCSILTTAPNLPSTTLQSGCYKAMFENCTSLTTAPSLPATTLAENCCQLMFKGCTSLTTAPSLSVTTLAEGCYSEMFYGCSKLTTAPNLPAETLQRVCYANMFEGCTSLTTAPTISAKALAENSCQLMFVGCTSLEAPADMSKVTTLDYACCIQMYQNCTSLKMYANDQTIGYKKAWTVPNITTAENWNENMFDDCGSDNCCSSIDPSLNTTYYVKGEGEETAIYTVTYDLNGGSGATPTDSNTYASDANVTLASTDGITKSGYNLLGWNTDSTATSALTSYAINSTDATDNVITLYAIWEDVNYNQDIEIDIDTIDLQNGDDVDDLNILLNNANLTVKDKKFYNLDQTAVDTITSAGNYYIALVLEGATNTYEFTNDGVYLYNGSTVTITPTSSSLVVARGCSAIDLNNLNNTNYEGNTKYLLVLCTCAIGYTVTYNANAGEDAVSNLPSASMHFGSDTVTVDTTTIPVRDGYKFAGWNTDSSATNAENFTDNQFDIYENTTLYAIWAENGHYIYNNGWNVAPETSYNAGDIITIISKTVGTSSFIIINGQKFYHPMGVASGWKKEYTIKNDGATLVLEEGTNFGRALITDGYKVTYDDNVADEDISVPTDDNYYGNHFEYNSKTFIVGKTVTISSTTPTRTGYKFLGWNKSSTATTATYGAGDTFDIDTSDVTLYAIWQSLAYDSAVSLTVSNLDVGVNASDITVTDVTSDLEVVKYVLTDTSYNIQTSVSTTDTYWISIILKGKTDNYYFVNDHQGDFYYYLNTVTVSSNQTMAGAVGAYVYEDNGGYAVEALDVTNNIYLAIRVIYTPCAVTYDDNVTDVEITVPSANSYFNGATVTVDTTTTPTRTGYNFLGWNENSSATEAQTFTNNQFTMGTSDVTLYAIWEVIPHTCNSITFDKVFNSEFVGGAITSGNYYLAEDITLTQAITIANGETVILCLNDKVLNLNGFNIQNTGSLTIYDCGTTIRYFTDEKRVTYEKSPVYTYVVVDGTDGAYETYIGNTSETENALQVTGGVITGGYGSTCDGKINTWICGGAIYNKENGTLIINNGNFVGNLALYGGAISNFGTAEMNNGNIIGNYCWGSGAGIHIGSCETESFTLNGGVISKNYSTNNGGGVVTNSPGVFTMNGGFITQNIASYYGAGVMCNGITNLLGGEISGNTITCTEGTYGEGYDSAGVCVWSSNYLIVGGTIIIKDNLLNGNQDNVSIEDYEYYWDSNEYTFMISSESPLAEGAYIGIKLVRNTGTFISATANSSDLQYFHVDDTNYGIIAKEVADSNPKTYNYNVEELYTITYDENNATSGSVPSDTNKYFVGDSVTLSENTGSLARNGYKFLGWNTDSSAETALTSYAIDTNDATNNGITLYAVWEDLKCNESFNLSISPTLTYNVEKANITVSIDNDKLQIDDWKMYDSNNTSKTKVDSSGIYYIGFEISVVDGGYFDMTGMMGCYNGYVEVDNGQIWGISAYSACDLENYTFTQATEEYEKTKLFVLIKFEGHSVTYEDNVENEEITVPEDTNSYLENTPVTISTTTPTRNGYKFLGWNESSSATEAQTFTNNQFTMGTSDVTLYAIWQSLEYKEDITFTITTLAYDLNFSDISVSVSDSKLSVTSFKLWYNNEEVSTITQPGLYTMYVIVEGLNDAYYFVNEADGYNIYYSGSISVSGNTLYASPSDMLFPYYLGVESCDITSTTNFFGNQSVNDYENVVLGNRLYFNLTGYSVTYNDNVENEEITVPEDTNSYLENAPVTISTTTPTRNGYKFLGWSDGTTTYQAGATYTVGTSNVTFTAQWEEKQTISLVTTQQKLAYTGNAVVPNLIDSTTNETTTLSGFELTYLEIKQAGNVDIESVIEPGQYNVHIYRAEDETYKAYTQSILFFVSYTITYDANGGVGDSVVDMGSVNHFYGNSDDESLVGNVKPKTAGDQSFTKEDYTISSWNTQTDGKGTAYSLSGEFENYLTGNITLYACYSANISAQPTSSNDYTVSVATTDNVTYQWFKGVYVEVPSYDTYNVTLGTDNKDNNEIISDSNNYQIWIATDFTHYIQFTTSATLNDGVSSVGGVYTYYPAFSMRGIIIKITSDSNFTISNIKWFEMQYSAIDGETSATLQDATEDAEYYCCITSKYNINNTTDILYPKAVSFAGGTDATGSVATMYQLEGRTITLPENGFTKTNYGFAGWKLNDTTYQVGDIYTIGASDVEFTAILNPLEIETADENVKLEKNDETGFDSNISVTVEVTPETNVESAIDNETITDYYNLTGENKLEDYEQVGVVFDVKLIQTTSSGSTEIQPSDLKEDTVLYVKMLIPQSVDISKVTKVMHVHNDNDIQIYSFDPSQVDENRYYTIPASKLSEFAFVYDSSTEIDKLRIEYLSSIYETIIQLKGDGYAVIYDESSDTFGILTLASSVNEAEIRNSYRNCLLKLDAHVDSINTYRTTKITEINTYATEKSVIVSSDYLTFMETIRTTAKLDSAVVTIKAEIDKVVADKTALDTALANLSTAVANVKSVVDTTSANLTTYTGQLSTAITTAQTAITNILNDSTNGLTAINANVDATESAILSAIENAKTDLANALKARCDAIDSALSTLTTNLSTDTTTITTAITNAKTAINELVNTETSNIDTAISNLSTKVGTAETNLTNAINTLKTDLVAGLNTQTTDLKAYIDSLEGKLNTKFTETNTAITTAQNAITQLVNTTTSDIDTALATLTTNVDNAKTAILTAISSAKTDLSNALKARCDAIDSALSTLTTNLATDTTAITTAITNAKTAIYELVNTETSNIDTAIATLSDKVGTAETNITNAINTLKTDLVAGLNTQTADLKAYIDTLEGKLNTKFSETNTAITTAQNAITQLVNTTTSDIDTAVATLTTNVDNAKTAILDAISSAKTDLANALKARCDAIDSALSTLTSNLATDTTAITTAITNAKTAINELVSDETDDIDTAIANLSTKVGTVESNLTSAITTATTTLTNLINSKIAEINTAIANLSDDLNADYTSITNKIKEVKDLVNETKTLVSVSSAESTAELSELIENTTNAVNNSYESLNNKMSLNQEKLVDNMNSDFTTMIIVCAICGLAILVLVILLMKKPRVVYLDKTTGEDKKNNKK